MMVEPTAKPVCFHCVAVRLHRLARLVAQLETASITDDERDSRRNLAVYELAELMRLLAP